MSKKKKRYWAEAQPLHPVKEMDGGMHIEHESAFYSGPIPMASELAKYEQVHPGAATRIISMTERQVEHRHVLEKTVINSNVRNERLGMHYSFLLTLMLMVLGAIMIFTEKETVGYFALFGPVVFHGGNYLFHKKKEKKVIEKKEGDQKVEN